MKQSFPGHTSHGKEHHDFISLISLSLLTLGLLILIYLLAFCHIPDREHTSLIRFASAREQEAEGNEISEAVFLSGNKNHRISLSPYSHRFFYIAFQKNYSLQILSGNSSVQVACYSQKGKQLSVPRDNQQYHIGKISEIPLSPGDRLFLKFSNMSTKPSAIKVKYSKNPARKTVKKNTATPKPKKTVSCRKAPKTQKKGKKTDRKTQTASKTSRTTSKPPKTVRDAVRKTPKPSQAIKNTVQTTPKPTKTANPAERSKKKEKTASTLSVTPHFLRMAAGSKKEIFLSLGKIPLTLADCTYFLTDTSVLSIQGNTLTAKKPGITILYVRSRNSAICGSCLIRVA